MEEKKPRGREKRLQYIRKGEDGKYVYTGELYTYRDGAARNSTAGGGAGHAGDGPAGARFKLLFLWALLMALCAAGGLIPARGMLNSFYVLIPYVIQFVAAAMLGMTVISLFAAGTQVRVYVYEAAVKKIPVRAQVTAIAAALSAAGELAFMILGGIAAADLGEVVLAVCSFFCAWRLRRYFDEIVWEKIK